MQGVIESMKQLNRDKYMITKTIWYTLKFQTNIRVVLNKFCQN